MIQRAGRRVGAYLIDIVLLFVVLAPVGLLVRTMLNLFPQTGPEIWLSILVNFSLPAWLYFTLSARSAGGATLGKRLLGIRVYGYHDAVSTGQALARTAVLLLPWELVHVSAFALSRRLDRLSTVQVAGLVVANALMVLYLIVMLATRGRRSVDDRVAGTVVDFVADRDHVAASRSRPGQAGGPAHGIQH